jgi:hypothetical protein
MAKLTLDGFDKFTAKRKVATSVPVFTIGKGGRMSINKYAYAKYFKVNKFVEFYYKPDEKIIAMKILKKPTENTYEVKKSPVSDIGSINAIAFFKHHDIDIKTKHYTDFLEADERKGIIFLKLKEHE